MFDPQLPNRADLQRAVGQQSEFNLAASAAARQAEIARNEADFARVQAAQRAAEPGDAPYKAPENFSPSYHGVNR